MAKYDDRNYIGDIVVADPPGTEDINLGDNALRSLARALKNAFPNSSGNDAYTGQLSDLDSIVAGTGMPKDTIVAWHGDQVTSPNGPTGWTICDGRARPGGGTAPDLRGRFLAGAQPDTGTSPFYGFAGAIGGNNEIDIRNVNGVLVEFTTELHTLTADQIGAHDHAMFTSETTNGDTALGTTDHVVYFGDNVGSNRAYKFQPGVAASPTLGRTGSAGTGGNQGHSHRFKIDGSSTFTGANAPAFFAVLYIIKD